MATSLQSIETYVDPALRKAARREAKRQRKHDDDARRRFDAWERYRALFDAIDLKRKLIDLGDTKARLALTIMGALNAAVFVLLFRQGPGVQLPYGLKPWLVTLLIVYGIVTFAFVVQTIEALRPRQDSRVRALREMRAREEEGTAPLARPLGLYFPLDDAAPPSMEEEVRMWSGATASEISAELVMMNRSVNDAIRRQFMALQKVYRGLKVLVVLAAVLLTLAGVVWSLQAGR